VLLLRPKGTNISPLPTHYVATLTTEGGAQEPALLAIAGFRRDGMLRPRRDPPIDRVREFAPICRESGPTPLPPLLVASALRPSYLVDCWLRCAAPEAPGWTSLPAIVISLARLEDVYLKTLAQATAGEEPLALTRVWKRAAVDRVLALNLGHADRCIRPQREAIERAPRG
jgi:hypothetical protein